MAGNDLEEGRVLNSHLIATGPSPAVGVEAPAFANRWIPEYQL